MCNPFAATTLYLRRKTKGNKIASVQYQFEVCGLETISLVDSTSVLERELVRHTYVGGNTTISWATYSPYFTTTSVNCGPYRFFLQKLDADGVSYTISDSQYITLEKDTFNIIVKTSLLYAENLYIVSQDHANVERLPLQITVVLDDQTKTLSYVN